MDQSTVTSTLCFKFPDAPHELKDYIYSGVIGADRLERAGGKYVSVSWSDNTPFCSFGYGVLQVVTPPEGKPSNPKDLIGGNKVSISCVPMNVIMEASLGLAEGMFKYGRHNYRNCGVRASIYYDAFFRHVGDWWEGEDIDPDSGLSHITKAISDLIVLRDSMLCGNWTDDRPPKSPKGWMQPLNTAFKEIKVKYQHMTPVHYFEVKGLK